MEVWALLPNKTIPLFLFNNMFKPKSFQNNPKPFQQPSAKLLFITEFYTTLYVTGVD